jgi:hypothetical protein
VKRRVFVASLAGLGICYLWEAIGQVISYVPPVVSLNAWGYLSAIWNSVAVVTCPLIIPFPDTYRAAPWLNALLYGIVAAGCGNRIRSVLAGVSVAVLFAAGAAAFYEVPTPWWQLELQWTIGAVFAALAGAATRLWSSALATLAGAAAGVFVAFGIGLSRGNRFSIPYVWSAHGRHVVAATLFAGFGWLLAEFALTWLKKHTSHAA